MRLNVFYVLFCFSFLTQPFSHSYPEYDVTIDFLSPPQPKTTMYCGFSPTHIQLPYERYNRRFQKKPSKKKQKKTAQRKQDAQRNHQQEHAQHENQYQQLCTTIEANFQGQYHEFKQYYEDEYRECNDDLYVTFNRNNRLEKRFTALQNIEHAGARYAHCNHLLTPEAVNHLQAFGYNVGSYQCCYGNQIQQIIHEDCITLLQETSTIPASSIMYTRVSAITDCIDAARAYNQAADCIKV